MGHLSGSKLKGEDRDVILLPEGLSSSRYACNASRARHSFQA